MKKNNTAILLILLITVISVMVLVYSKKDYISKYNHIKKLDIIIDEIMKRDPNVSDYSDIELLTDDEIENLKESSNNRILSKLYFVEGYFEKLNSNYEAANKDFEKSISFFDYSIQKDMKARVYYERSRCFLKQNEKEKSKAEFAKVKELFKDDKNLETLVKLNLLRAIDLNYFHYDNNENINLLTETLEIAREIHYEKIEDVYYYLALAYWYDDKKIQAINYKIEALNIANEKNNYDDIVRISIEMGIDFLEINNYDEAIRYIRSALNFDIDDHDGESLLKSYAWLNLYEAYSKAGYHREAEEALKHSEIYIDKQKDSNRKTSDKILLEYSKADFNTRLGNIKEAKKYLEKCENDYNNIDKFEYMGFDIKLKELHGNIYYKSKQYEKALEYHLEAKQLANKKKFTYSDELHNYYIYMDYQALGNYKKAFEYADMNNKLKDKYKTNNDSEYSQYLVSKFASDKKEKRIAYLEKSKKDITVFFIVLAIITIVSMIFTSLIYKKNKEIKRLNKLFKNLSITDSLTRIPNRRALDEFLSVNWGVYKKESIPISFIMIDVDYFKKYNDNYGHQQGDEVLKKVSNCIKSCCRKFDFVARYGGEEFIIIMINANKDESIKVASRILHKVRELNIKHEYSEVSNKVTISAGISTAYSYDDENYDKYICLAVEALYRAKKKRNTYCYN